MKGKLLGAIILVSLALLSACAQADEYRDMYATAWGSAFESASATTTYVNYAFSCNCNVVVPEIRLRCDAYYTSSIEPPGTGVTISPPGFDSLADLITKTHAKNMKTHPWVVTYRIWTTTSGPGHTTPEHIWWTHGPGNTDPSQDWMMLSETGGWDYGGIVNLDPGHPAVEDYLVTVFMDIVNRYEVDGFLLDYIRYPATSWGYNAVSVARYNAEYGTTGNPSAGNTTWQNWRRDQVSNLVKRLYLEIKASKPWVKLGASVWHTASVGNNSYFQNWDSWMQNHWMDYVSPMMYTSDNGTFEGYLHDAMGRQYGHHIYPLPDASNDINACVLPQIDLTRSHGFLGVGLYAYQSIADKTGLKNALVGGPFPTFVAPTPMSWLNTPTKGYLKGFVKNASLNAVYPATVTILSTAFSTKDSGTGFYGFSEVTPGSYTVRAEAPGYNPVETPVTITAGAVADLDFTLPPDTIPPVITNVRAENIQASNAQIKWDTDELATSQVDYGLTALYGTTTTEDMVRVAAHTVQLVNLAPLTTYHFRVRSYDAARNMTQSTDYTFSTIASDTPADIIVDNSDAGCTTSGSWFTGTSSTDKWGPNYFYCSISGGTKTATWRPSVVSAGRYNVYAWWPAGANRTTNAPYIVQWSGGSGTYPQNQQVNGGTWNLLVANVQFAVGTAGYIRVSNTLITPTNVMADAIRLQYADTTPPTDPTDLSATAMSATQISLSWTASTDNIGVTGYDIYRNAVKVNTSPSNSYNDGGLAANTLYSYYVKAYDGQGNRSVNPSNTVARYTLSAVPGSGSVTCDKTVNTWQASSAFTFTAVGGFGAGKIQSYRYAWNQSSTHSWTGYEPSWTSGTLAQNAPSAGSWYLHVKGYNAEGLENGSYSYGPYKYDGTAAQVTSLNDHGKYIDATGSLYISWSGSDPESGVSEYKYAIGTTPENLGTIRDWTSTSTGTSVTVSDLSLVSQTKYYVGVKALNGAGTWSDPVVSDGITAADVIGTIHEAKEIADDRAIILPGKVVSANFGTFFYVCESDKEEGAQWIAQRASAIRVEGMSAIEGDLTTVGGILDTVSGERELSDPDHSPASGPGTPDPMMITVRSIGGEALNDNTPGITDGIGTNNIGVLVTVVGTVEGSATGYFMVRDGSGSVKVSTLMLTDIPGDGALVRLTGIVSTEEEEGVVTPILLPRGDADCPKPWY